MIRVLPTYDLVLLSWCSSFFRDSLMHDVQLYFGDAYLIWDFVLGFPFSLSFFFKNVLSLKMHDYITWYVPLHVFEKSLLLFSVSFHLNGLFVDKWLAENMEFVDDLLTFEELGLHLKSQGCHVANLSSLDFSVKNGIGGCLRSLLRQLVMVTLDVRCHSHIFHMKS